MFEKILFFLAGMFICLLAVNFVVAYNEHVAFETAMQACHGEISCELSVVFPQDK